MNIHIIIIDIILKSIKYRNKKLLLNLIKAELISSSGHLTKLAMMVNPKKYHSIHKLFSRVEIDYISIQIEIILAILMFFKIEKVSVSIDDSIIYRSRTKKIPCGHKQYDHAHKANRPSYIFGQKWLAFGLIITIAEKTFTIPLYIYLVDPKNNLITTTIFILEKMRKVMDKRKLNLEVEVLTDSWFAKERLVLRAKHVCKFSVITMARKDLALYKLPPFRKKGTIGRPRKKGKRIKPEFKDLKKTKVVNIYNRMVKIEYKEAICKARFLKYETVKAVWIRFDESQSMRLLISTDTKLSGEEIIKRYAKRWDIESMFNELKNRFNFKDIMMHKPKSYYQFLYFKIWCFIIIKISSIQFKKTISDYVKDFLPWRVHYEKGITVTAGSTQLALKSVFITLHISLFFPKVDEKISDNSVDNEFMGFGLDKKYEMTG